MDKYTKIDTSAALFDNRYLVSIRTLDVRTISDIKAHGTYTTGDKGFDQALMNARQKLYLNIAEIVTYHKQGVEVRLTNPADGKNIYDAITAHLERWSDIIRKNLNMGDAPVEDLRDLDNYASTIYDVVKYQYKVDRPGDSFLDGLQAVLGENNNVVDSFQAVPEVITFGAVAKNEDKTIIPEYEEREGFGDVLRRAGNVRIIRT